MPQVAEDSPDAMREALIADIKNRQLRLRLATGMLMIGTASMAVWVGLAFTLAGH